MSRMKHHGLGPLLGLLCVLALETRAQAPTTGDGLVGAYYEGMDFERLVLTRRDATIAFDWTQRPPAAGMPPEYYSVRWTGWLVPPASGRYRFYATVDDGMRIWLNDRLILDEWRPQPIQHYTVGVELKAGEPYRLRVDYFQEILDTRARLTWERPDAPPGPPPASWRNLWGLNAEAPTPAPIPTQFLFTRNPRPTPPVAAPPPPVLATGKGQPRAQQKRLAPQLRRTQGTRPVTAARPASGPTPAAPIAPVALPSAALLVADSGSRAQLLRLNVGEAVTLPELYFNQGKAQLLPPARTALDGLATALASRPELRLEVQGHTDNVGDPELNRRLSQQRAEAVCRYLATRGVAASQLRPVGYGGTRPVADNADPARRPRNRRVVLQRL